MAVQLQVTLPLDWASDFDRVAERWYFYHRPSGFCQYLLPKTGDEITRAAELVPRLPPRPAQSSITTGMEAVSIVQDRQMSTVTTVMVQHTQMPTSVADVSQAIQRKISTPNYPKQTPSAPGSAPQQNLPSGIPNLTSVRRSSGAVARKPLPKQNSAPQQQQQPQAPVQQRQDSQISPRSSVSQTSITQSTVQQAQDQAIMSPRSSMSQNSIAESPIQQAFLLQQNQQQPIQSPRSSLSQAIARESPLQQANSQLILTNGAIFQHQIQKPNSAVHPPQQNSPQYTTTITQSPTSTPGQEQPPENSQSVQAPIENPAESWPGGFIESTQIPAQCRSHYARSGRPKLANRLSSSAIKMPQKAYSASKDYIKAHPDAIKMPQKAYSASKDYIKAHPGKTTAIAGGIIGGIGVVAEVCGVNGLSDAVAASKIYLNVQRANQRKKKAHSLPHSTTHDAAAGVAQNDFPTTNSNGPSAKEVAEELFRMMQQQGQIPSLGQNSAPPSNNSQVPNQGGPSNPQAPSQQYFPPQYQPQFVPKQAPVQPFIPGPNIQFPVPPGQASPPLTIPDPSLADYQPPPSPTIPTGSQTPPTPSQCPTNPISFSDPSCQPPPLFDASTFSPDQSTLQYDQFLQDQATTAVVNQAIFNSQAFTTSLTGQDMFVPGDGQSDTCSLNDMPLQTADATADVSSLWASQSAADDDYSSDDDNGYDYDSC